MISKMAKQQKKTVKKTENKKSAPAKKAAVKKTVVQKKSAPKVKVTKKVAKKKVIAIPQPEIQHEVVKKEPVAQKLQPLVEPAEGKVTPQIKKQVEENKVVEEKKAEVAQEKKIVENPKEVIAERKKEEKAPVKPKDYKIRLMDIYRQQVVPQLMKEFLYKNVMQVPRLGKIIVNRGVGAATQDKKFMDSAVEELTMITGQKPVIAKSKKAISNFKLRENIPIACRVTLRGKMMYEFLDRLIVAALPRVRDFRGLEPRGFDGRGNFTLGIKEQIIFLEINVDKISNIGGMDITFVTSANTDKEGLALLKAIGLPFRN